MAFANNTSQFASLSDLTSSFSAERLTALREASGYGVNEFAAAIGATASAVSQLEHGHSKPRVETLLRIAVALGVPPTFFGIKALPTVSVTQCHFRSLRSATKREQRAVLARARLIREVIALLEDRLVFPIERLSALRIATEFPGDIESATLRVREQWGLGLGPISDVVGLLEANGVIPVEVAGASARMDAFSFWSDNRPFVFLNLEKTSASRRRFDAAHELAHLLLHRDVDAGGALVESTADRFASSLLLPARTFRSECPERLVWSELRRLKRRWGVSLQAIVRRAFELGIYSESTYRRAYVQINRLGWRTGEPDEPALERPTLLRTAAAQLAQVGVSKSRLAAESGLGEKLYDDLLGPALHAA